MKKYIGIFLILAFGIIATINLLHPGFPVTHDGQDHIARIANFYLNLSQGVFIPRWAANLNYGYGHPILEFLYPFPSYVASLFHFLGFSLINATKLVFGLAMIASGMGMYLFVKKLWGNTAGIISGVLYMYAPYRFVDLYVRGDIGEHMAFVFVPLSFLGLLLLSKKQSAKNIIFASLMIAILILSHNAIALMFMPLILLHALFLFWESRWDKKLAYTFFSAITIGFLLSGFFWFPALFEGQYTLRNIVTKGEYITRFVSMAQLLYGKWDYGNSGLFTVQLGLLHWIALVASAIFVFRKKSKYVTVFLIGSILYTSIAIFLMLPVSNFIWQRVIMLQNFQFPWRFLAIPVFTLSLLGGFCIAQFKPLKKVIISSIVIGVLLLVSKDYMHAKTYEQKPESFFTEIYNKTTDTGESSPIWSVRFMLAPFHDPLQVIAGEASVTNEKRKVTEHLYIVSSQGTTRLLENTLYFPGWKILVDNKPVVVQFQDPAYRGLMTFFITDGTHTVHVIYSESKLRLIGDALSILGIVSIGSILIAGKLKKRV